MKTYRVAVLGCRNRGTKAALAYHAHPRTEVVGLCDLVKERRDELGERLGVADRFSDLDAMVTRTAPDIVAVPTASDLHYPLCMQLLDLAPVHIDVEKPMTVDLAQADRLVERARERGTRISVHHQGRSGPALQAVAKAVESGRIGEPRALFAHGKGYYGGYDLMNIGCHIINAMLEVTGHCRRVLASAVTGGRTAGPEDVLRSPNGMGVIVGEHLTATFEYENGLVATLAEHRLPTVDSTAMHFEVHGSRGRVYWHPLGGAITDTPYDRRSDDRTRWQPLAEQLPDGVDRADADEYLYVDDWVTALDNDTEHRSSGIEGRHVLEMMMGIFESVAGGGAVELPQASREVHPLSRWLEIAGNNTELPELPRAYGDWLEAEGRRLGWSADDAEFRYAR